MTMTTAAPKLHTTQDSWDPRTTVTAPRTRTDADVTARPKAGNVLAALIALVVAAFIVLWPFALGRG